jgi:protein arginine kinase activator
MMCERCNQNAASVHMQQFIGGQKVELHLCQQCAFKADNHGTAVPLENIFKSILEQMDFKSIMQGMPLPQGVQGKPPKPAATDKVCSRCGMTLGNFKEKGRLGCDVCYQSFAAEVEVLLKSVQGSTRHEGKYPRRMGVGLITARQITELRNQLKRAIEEENYEEAVRLRDEIRLLEAPQEIPPTEEATE